MSAYEQTIEKNKHSVSERATSFLEEMTLWALLGLAVIMGLSRAKSYTIGRICRVQSFE